MSGLFTDWLLFESIKQM